MRTLAGCILLILSLRGASAQEAADRCRDILVHAAHNIDQSLRTTQMASDLGGVLCGTPSSDGDRGGGSAAFAAFNPKESARKRIQRMRDQVCVGGRKELDDSQLEQTLSDLVDQGTLGQWRDCMRAEGTGLIGTIERDGDSAVIRLRWTEQLGVQRAVIENVAVTGLECPSMWTRGTVVGNAPLVVRCDGNRDLAIDIAIRTDRDAIRLRSPIVKTAASKAAPPRSEREGCFAGDVDACFYAAMENGRKCAPLDRSGAEFQACHQQSLVLLDLWEGLKARNSACVNRSGAACREAIVKVEEVRKRGDAPVPNQAARPGGP